MKAAHSNPDQLWRAFLIAQTKLEQHQLQAPTKQIRRLQARVRITVVKGGAK